jgi:uncharacterized protein YpmS
MDESRLKRSDRKKNKVIKKHNYWKWAFIILLALMLGSSLFFVQQLTSQNVAEQQVSQATKSLGKHTSINVQMNKRQLNAAMNYYLKRQQRHKKVKYKFYVDQAAILVGTTEILGQNVSFSLYTEPTVTSKGNILLHAKSVAIGTLSAPPKFILNYIQKNYQLGKWVTIDSQKETIRLNLSRIKGFHGITVKAQKIDLTNNIFRFKVNVPLK